MNNQEKCGLKINRLKEGGLKLITQTLEEWKSTPNSSQDPAREWEVRRAANKQLCWLLPACDLRNMEEVWFDSPLGYIQYMGALYVEREKQGVDIDYSYRKMQDFVWQEIKYLAWTKVINSVSSDVWNHVWQNLRLPLGQLADIYSGTPLSQHLENEFIDHFLDTYKALYSHGNRQYEVNGFLRNLDPGGLHTEIHWIAFYDFFTRLGILDLEAFNRYKMLLKSGVFMITMIGNACCMVRPPYRISRNSAGQLHNEQSSALEWTDGYELYFWNGVKVDARLIKRPETITGRDILNEQNVEVRRCMLEKLGPERYANLLGIQPIDSGVDFQGNEQVLFKTQQRDSIANNHLYFVKVTCPSTGRKYFLSVPPMTNVREAVAWTFGKNPKSYQPVIET